MEENIEKNLDIKNKIIPIIVLVLVILAIVGYFVFGKNKIQIPINNNVASVANVNGDIITKADYETQLANSLDLYKTQGVDVTDVTKLSQIKTQVLDNLIADKLISQGVEASGIKVTAEEIEKQFQIILTQLGGADALKAELVKNKLTEAQLRDNISKQLAAQQYLLQNIDTKSIIVSDAEIAQLYTDYSKEQKAKNAKAVVPALKDISNQIKQNIISNKQQVLVVDFIASLRAKAKIEITLQ
ncbi:MAG: SurA N-terminal domain-containing protein [Candidatus Paceibacterota bacterium]